MKQKTLEGITSRLDEAEDQISELQDKVGKKHPGRARKGKETQKERTSGKGSVRQHENNIRIIGIPEGKEEEQGIENLFEKVMMEPWLV